MDAMHTETVVIDGAEYTIRIDHDIDAESPRNDECPGTRMYAWTLGHSLIRPLTDELTDTDAGDALVHFIERFGHHSPDTVARAFGKWAAITGSTWRLFTGTRRGYSQSDWFDAFVLVDADDWSDGADLAIVARSEMDTYAAWMYGDVATVSVTRGDGEYIDSLSGMYPDADGNYSDAIAEARGWIESDADDRRAEAARAGAGFVGII